MNSGTLLLASDIPVFREIYDGNAEYFDPKSISSIRKVLERATDMSQKERDVRIDKAKDFVKRYSWAKMAKETLRIYEAGNSLR